MADSLSHAIINPHPAFPPKLFLVQQLPWAWKALVNGPPADLLFHGLRTRILFIVWPQLWERSPDIAVIRFLAN